MILNVVCGSSQVTKIVAHLFPMDVIRLLIRLWVINPLSL